MRIRHFYPAILLAALVSCSPAATTQPAHTPVPTKIVVPTGTPRPLNTATPEKTVAPLPTATPAKTATPRALASKPAPSKSKQAHQPSSGVARALEAAPASWHLNAPLSRATVLSQNGDVIVAGGLIQSGQSASGVFRIQPDSGSRSLLGTLPFPVHDAAGAILHGQIFVFGGGSTQTISAVQRITPVSGGVVAGRLPVPRSDLASVTIGGHAYVLGGYDGANSTAGVLATADGTHFRRVARLSIPVRYPAVAALGGRIFVFGGQLASGYVRAIQQVNPASGRTRVVAQMPFPISHASAFVLDKHLYVVGGMSGKSMHRAIWSFDPVTARVSRAGYLSAPLSDTGVAVIGSTAYLIGGENAGTPQSSVITLRAQPQSRRQPSSAMFPFSGRLLIADRGNNRLLLVDATRHVVWRYPSVTAGPPPGGFYYPDDAFFSDRGSSIVINEEGNETVVRVAFPSGRLQWSYGHPGIIGRGNGYLHSPDDAYVLKNGQVVIADDANCRVLFVRADGSLAHQIGTTGLCLHRPPTGLGSPNGDTPLSNGNILISEINGSWISEYTPEGRLAWTVHLPIVYPSDPQQIGPDRYLVADYASPGAVYEFSRAGAILWSYGVTSGPGMLDHPSLAERLPNGLICVTDDYRHRIVIIDPINRSIVWQFGQTDVLGSADGYLNTPDGFDLLAPDNRTPTHLATR